MVASGLDYLQQVAALPAPDCLIQPDPLGQVAQDIGPSSIRDLYHLLFGWGRSRLSLPGAYRGGHTHQGSRGPGANYPGGYGEPGACGWTLEIETEAIGAE